MRRKYIQYDTLNDYFWPNAASEEIKYAINAYDDSSASLAVSTDGTISDFQQRILKMKTGKMDLGNNALRVVKASMIAFIILVPLFLSYVLNDPIVCFCTIILFLPAYLAVKLIDVLRDETAIYLEGIGDHITDDDVDHIIAIHRKVSNRNEFISGVRHFLAQRDPTGVRPELIKEYNDHLRKQLDTSEKKKIDSLNSMSSLDMNQPSLSVRLQHDDLQKETDDWSRKLNDLSL